MAMGLLEGWDLVDSIYYSLCTASTLGFGDKVPRTLNGRRWAIFFIPLAAAAAANELSELAYLYIGYRQKRAYDKLVSLDLTLEYLEEMDSNRDGKISKDEYKDFMLVAMNLVDKEQLDELDEQFERLDVLGTGYLDREDLMLMAKLRTGEARNSTKVTVAATPYSE
jgi:potassium channel subfamily K